MQYRPGRCLLLNLLNRHGMTRIELAERLGVSRSSVTAWCDDDYVMSYGAAYNICLIFGCKMEDLYEWIHED